MKKLIIILFILGFNLSYAQYSQPRYLDFQQFQKIIQKDIVIIEFNAPFNKNNALNEWYELKDCNYYRVCIKSNPQLKEKYNIISVPTLILFNKGVKEKTYRANIMLQLPVSCIDLQEDINKLLK